LAGDGWVAAGEAAAAYDPLSSHGIGSALAGGRQAAAALAAALEGDSGALTAYAERLRAGYARYLWLRHAFHADERRWPAAPFWARRHEAPSAPGVDAAAVNANRPPGKTPGAGSRNTLVLDRGD
jgi:2-polyprenyl-6-methoxyphenol hydroxylase-like FAD-dependent oxidoreductase